MKNLILASIVALTSTLPFALPSSAASMHVTTRERVVDHRHGQRMMDRRHHASTCFVKKVKTHTHGRVVFKTTKVCK